RSSWCSTPTSRLCGCRAAPLQERAPEQAIDLSLRGGQAPPLFYWSEMTSVQAMLSCTDVRVIHDKGSTTSLSSDCASVRREPSTATTRCRSTSPPSVRPQMLQHTTW